MKKYIFLLLITVGLFSCSLSTQYNLDKMGESAKQHIKYRDIDNNTVTKIEYLEPVSYEKIPKDKRESPDEAYLCKIYIQGTWAYANSYRIFNINDTINCYFDSNFKVLKMDENKEN